VRIKELIDRGALGHVHALDLVFHNAYGPDKPWFYDRSLSGGGCLIDLGLHLVDATLWLLDNPRVERVRGRLHQNGRPFSSEAVEDYAVVELLLEEDRIARIACSWRLHAGRDAVIGVDVYGTEGGAGMRNVGGSFYDFVAEHWVGTSCTTIASPPDTWGGRALVAWAQRLARGETLSRAEGEELVRSAEVLDAVYLQNERTPRRNLDRALGRDDLAGQSIDEPAGPSLGD
jgi:predicted dehydrogenase